MRAPRRSFAAPLVITMAALPGCASTVDHRDPVQPTTVTTTDPADHRNDPPPTPTPTAAGATWHIVVNSDGSCVAAVEAHCDARPVSCNPPRPMPYACPSGATNDNPFLVQQTDAGDCVLISPTPACPAGTMCNPPPAQKVDCPHY
jgi:hypothetical protein